MPNQARLVTFFVSSLFVATVQAAVTGTVVRDDGSPVAGATVRAFAPLSGDDIARVVAAGAVPDALATATTQPDGRFSIDAKSNPTVRLIVDANGTSAITTAANDDDAGAILLPKRGGRLRVVADGKPVPNALVVLRDVVVKTNGEGWFPTEPMDAPVVIVPDYAPSAGNDREGDDVVVTRGVTVRGKVVARDGAPVANAAILLRGIPVAHSASDGTFVVAHAPERWRAMDARSGNLAGAATNGGASNVVIKLQPAATLSGNLTASSGGPVAGATVTVMTHNAASIRTAISDAKGHYAIDGLVPSQYLVRITHPQFGIEHPPELAILKTMTRNVTLVPAARVSGRVVDEAGKPVGGAIITAVNALSTPALSTSGGDFALRVMPSGMPVQLAAMKSEFATTAVAPLAIAPGATKGNLTITLRRGFPLQVHVIDAARKPLPGIRVEFITGSSDPSVPRIQVPCGVSIRDSCRTDAEGALTVRIVEGKYEMRLNGDGIAATILPARSLSPRESPLVLTADAAVEVSGRVTYDDGTPVANARVMTRSPREASVAVTDARGNFTLTNLARITVPIFATTADEPPMQSATIGVTPPARDVSIVFPRPARLEGRVIDRVTSQPVTAFNVTITTPQNRMPAQRIGVTNDDGTFAVEHVMPGQLELHIDAPQYVAATASDVTAEEGKTVSGIEVKLDRAAKVTGRITASGKALAGVRVRREFRAGRAELHTGVSDDSGEFVLDGVPPGEQTIDFTKDGYVTQRRTITADASKETRIDLELDHGREIHGRVIDRQGNAVAVAQITANDGPTMAHTTSGDDGSFTLAGFADGARVNVSARKNGWVGASAQDVDPAANQVLTLTLDRGGIVTGHVHGLADTDVPLVEVRAAAPNAWTSARVDTAGNFTLSGVPDGRVTITAIKTTPPMRESTPHVIDVVNGTAPPIDIDFTEGIDVHGHVTRNGAPLAGGSLAFMPHNPAQGAHPVMAAIASDGSYDAAGLVAGDYTVRLTGAGGMNDLRQYTVTSSATYDIALQGGAVRGRVIDASTNAPIADASVTLMDRVSHAMRSGTADFDGRFVVDTVPDGSYVLRVAHDGYAVTQQDLTVSAGGTAPVDVALTPGTAARIRVVDADTGAPIDSAFASVSGGPHNVSTQAVRADDGTLKAWVEPGRYQVSVFARGYAQGKSEVTVPGDELRIALARAGALRLASTSGGQYLLQMAGEPKPNRGASVPPGGSVVIESLAPGVWTVRKMDVDIKTVLREYTVTIAGGQTVTLNTD